MNDVISQLEFNPLNPFDFDIDIIPERFVRGFYNEYLLFCYINEYKTTIVYPAILNNLKNNRHESYIGSFSQQDREQLYQYFEKMINDENEHTDQFTIILDKLDIQDVDLPKLKKDSEWVVENTELINLLINLYVGECYLWASFFQIYKTTFNQDKKQLIKKLLVDESQHNKNILHFFKKIKQNVKLPLADYISTAKENRFMSLPYIQREFKIPTDSIAFKKVIQTVYNHEWHNKFNDLMIKKTYQLCAVLFPDVTQDEFRAAVNG